MRFTRWREVSLKICVGIAWAIYIHTFTFSFFLFLNNTSKCEKTFNPIDYSEHVRVVCCHVNTCTHTTKSFTYVIEHADVMAKDYSIKSIYNEGQLRLSRKFFYIMIVYYIIRNSIYQAR